MTSALEKATTAANSRGFQIMLCQDLHRRIWQAMALGDHPEMTPTGAKYNRAIGSGKTADEALLKLAEELATLAEKAVPAKKTPAPVQMELEDDYDDLC